MSDIWCFPGDMLLADALGSVDLWESPRATQSGMGDVVAQLKATDLCLVLSVSETADHSSWASWRCPVFVLSQGRLGWIRATGFLSLVKDVIDGS